MNPASLVEKHLPTAVQLRHRLHMIPEIGYQEFKTAESIRAELTRLGVEFIAGVTNAPTATIAHIGDRSKPCIALRADIDGLPIIEQTYLEYASTHAGRMHACGHDGHTATLLGVAGALKAIEKELPVCVKLFWQPAEEGGAGAKRMVDAGLLDGRLGPKASAVFGLHGWPTLPVGTVSTRPGALLAATDSFTAQFIGRGTHAAYPHLGIDPIVTACEAVLNIQQFATRDMDPTEPVVVTIGKFNAGTASNVIPDSATIEATVRTLHPATGEKAQAVLERRCNGIAAANGCVAKFSWTDGYPATINDPAMADYVAAVARESLGNSSYLPAAAPSMGGEDFAYYLQQTPGCFFFVGTCPTSRQTYHPLHSDLYDYTDATVGIGMRMFLEIVMRFKK